jgi:8-oxo-dGTP diphosphatase
MPSRLKIGQRPLVTVEVVLFAIRDSRLCVALAEREEAPFRGRLGLLGGPVVPERDRDVAGAAARMIRARTSLDAAFLEQLMSFSGPDRDPRGWSVAVTYYALVPGAAFARASAGVDAVPVERLPRLVFDHDKIVAAALARLRGKSAYTSLPAFLLPPQFTFPELKSAYETAMGVALNDSAFRRKIGELKIIEEVGDAKSAATAARKRPAQLYRLVRPDLVEFDRTI